MIFHELLHLYCTRASAIEANNKIMKETEAFVKKIIPHKRDQRKKSISLSRLKVWGFSKKQ